MGGKGCLGARQYSGWYHGVVMALEEQARGVVLHWKMHNVSGEGGGPGSHHRPSGTVDGGFTGSLFQVLAGGRGWSISVNQRYAQEIFQQQRRGSWGALSRWPTAVLYRTQ